MAERAERNATSDAYVTAGAGNAWSAEAAGRGQVGSQRLLSVSTVEPPEQVRAALALRPDERVVVRNRLMLLDERPVEIASSYYPEALAAGTPLAETTRIRGGAIAALAALGHAPAEVFERVTARRPDADEVAVLEIDPQEPLLVLMRTNFDSAGRPVEYAINRMVARLSDPIAYRMRTTPA